MRRHSLLILFSLVGGLILTLAGALLGPVPTAFGSIPQEAGYADFSHSGVDLPSSDKPQSKLWFNDGRWWASMYYTDSGAAGSYHVYWLDLTKQDWIDTGTVLDNRPQTQADILWDNTAKKLYIVSGGAGSDGWFLRYSYNAATRSYSRDFAPVVVRKGGAETIVIDKDSTGKLWITYTQANQVYVNSSTTDDATWGSPFIIPGARMLDPDDISSIIAYKDQNGPSIGVLWSNHNAPSSMYFAYHRDSAASTTWQSIETLYTATCAADDHINLKSLQADASGTLFAIVKTSFGDTGCGGNTSSPLIRLVVRKANNTWVGPVTFGTVADEHTRPVLLLDTSNRKIYVFATSPTACGAIYMKTASMDNPTAGFSPVGRGTPFIKSNIYTCINNATTTKQTVDASTGLAVLASDEHNLMYLHNYIDLGSTTYPRLVFSTNPRLGQANTPFATQPVVTIQSAPNQINTSFNGPVTLSLKSGTGSSGATLSGSMTVNAVNGVATFSGLALSKAGIGYRLTANAGLAATLDSALFDVAKSDQTISFSAPTSKQYGDAAFSASATASSGLPVSFSATGSCTIAGASVTLTSAGSCALTASQAGDTAYNAAPSVTQTFTVLKAQQSIDFEPLPTKRYGDPPFTVSATASSGLPVSFRASGTCVVIGNKVTITGAAECTIRANQAGNANFNPAAEVTQPIKAQQAVSVSIFVPIAAR